MYVASISAIALIAAACGTSGPSADDLNANRGGNVGTGGSTAPGSGGSSPLGTGGSPSGTGGSSQTGTGGSTVSTSGGSDPGSGGSSTLGGSTSSGTGGVAAGTTGGATPGTGGSSMTPTGGSAGTVASGGAGGQTGGAGGAPAGTGGNATGGSATGGSATGGSGGQVATGPYAPRTGSFKMLAYSATKGFRHDSIPAGKEMLQALATQQGFQVKITETNEDITAAGLAQYEIVFFMNSTGDIFNEAEQKAFEDWMTTKNGAFAGSHSATDTESGWAWYKEVTGQYYDLHDNCCAQANIVWDTGALDFIAVKGLPSPWQRGEEWYLFNKAQDWSTKAGFKILGRVTTNNNTRPVSYIREWGNFRAFYSSLGHQAAAFQDVQVRKHFAAGIMWAVRREALLK